MVVIIYEAPPIGVAISKLLKSFLRQRCIMTEIVSKLDILESLGGLPVSRLN